AGDEDAVPILLGLGLDEFSASPTLVPHVKEVLRGWTKEEAKTLAEKLKNLTSAEEVRKAVQTYQPKST
ncbi:MAG: putative PEP-binding protein, partial [Chloroflexota bacterium]